MTGWGYFEDQSECVFAIQVESEQTLLADKAERLIQGEGSKVVEFRLEDDLNRALISKDNRNTQGGWVEGFTSSTPCSFMTFIEFRTRVLANMRLAKLLRAR